MKKILNLPADLEGKFSPQLGSCIKGNITGVNTVVKATHDDFNVNIHSYVR